tara:strand:+ start:1278 stop:1646 length:369 start_codon:yes stop_codon:yes gene_type:complete
MNNFFIINILCSLTAVTSNYLFKTIFDQKLNWNNSIYIFLIDIFKTLMTPLSIIAVIVFISSNLIWFYILSTQKFSLSFPLHISLVFVFSYLISNIFLGEILEIKNVFALFLIGIGILILTK